MMDSWEISDHPQLPQMTDINPNNGEPVIRLKGLRIKNDYLKAGKEVS
jgi:hypothetical protein